MAYLSFGEIDKNIFPIIIGCVFAFFSRLIFTINGAKLFEHPVISNTLAAASKLFAFVPFIIVKIRSKKSSYKIEKNNTLNSKDSLLYTITKKKINKTKFIFIFLSAFIFVIQGVMFSYTLIIKTNCWIWDIVIYCVFCYLIFKKKLYKHHYLSASLIILMGMIFDLIYHNIQNDILNHILLLLLRIVREILYSSHDIINKYTMEKNYSSVYELTFFIGCIDLFLFGLFSILNIYYLHLDNMKEYFENFDTKELFVCIGFSITQFGFVHL